MKTVVITYDDEGINSASQQVNENTLVPMNSDEIDTLTKFLSWHHAEVLNNEKEVAIEHATLYFMRGKSIYLVSNRAGNDVSFYRAEKSGELRPPYTALPANAISLVLLKKVANQPPNILESLTKIAA